MPLDDDQTASQSGDQGARPAISNAKAVKADPSHVLAIAVGAAVQKQPSLDRLISMSGPDVYSGAGEFDITTDDVYWVPDFAQLEAALREAAFQLCAPSLTVRKLVDRTPDPGTDDANPEEAYDITTQVSVPAGTFDVGETWVYEASGTATLGQYANVATASGLDELEQPVSDTDPSHYLGQQEPPPTTSTSTSIPTTTTPLTIAPTTAVPPTSPAGGGGTASTGANSVPWALLALILIVGGATATLATRGPGAFGHRGGTPSGDADAG